MARDGNLDDRAPAEHGDSPACSAAKMNEQAKAQISAPVILAIVPGATHLFEEPGALEHVARLASDSFRVHLAINTT